MATLRRRLFSRRTLGLVTASTLGLAGGGYYYLNSGPAPYPASTRETRRPPPIWTPPPRQAMLDALERSGTRAAPQGEEDQDVFDVLVVGGGATGAGVAVDAASRGLKVALVERNDFSSGTSRTTFFSSTRKIECICVGNTTQARRPSRPSSSMAAYVIYKRQ